MAQTGVIFIPFCYLGFGAFFQTIIILYLIGCKIRYLMYKNFVVATFFCAFFSKQL